MQISSLLYSLASLVEIFEEVTLVLVYDFLVVGEALISLYILSAKWCYLVKNNTSPDVSLLDIVKSFIASSHEVVNSFNITHFIVLPPVLGELQLSHLGICVPSVAEEVDDEGHVSTVLSE